ncbi:MAG: deoxyribose-phosphate aldolase [Bacteroidota bacterium]
MINETEITTKVNQLLGKGLGSYTEKEALKIVMQCIDLTTLEGADTTEKVIALCHKAKSFAAMGYDIPNVAAVCVYPTLVAVVKEALKGTAIRTASVAGAFPSGQSPLFVKLVEVKYALDEGADEIDMVISRGSLLEGEYQKVQDEIAAIKEYCGKVHLKVILETGELLTLTNVRKASEIAIAAGADFLKTSTGKISPGATETAFYVMAEAIKEHYLNTGKKVGIKAAGGVAETDQALNYLKIVKEILGTEWLNKDLFRIGASRLADKIAVRLST